VTELATVQVERRDTMLIARLSGEIDLTNADTVGREIGSSVTNDLHRVILDCSELRFLDSTGVRLVLGLAQRLRTRQQSLVIVVPERSAVRKVLSITRVDSLAPFALSLAQALDDGH